MFGGKGANRELVKCRGDDDSLIHQGSASFPSRRRGSEACGSHGNAQYRVYSRRLLVFLPALASDGQFESRIGHGIVVHRVEGVLEW